MESHKPGMVTQLLRAAENGDDAARNDLWSMIYAELHSLARMHLANEKNGQARNPTSIVSEAYLRLAPNLDGEWSHRGHFFSAAAQAMRRILVDYARTDRSLKRGGDARREMLEPDLLAPDDGHVDVIVLDEALDRFERLHPIRAQVVTLRYFGGLTVEETAEALGVCTRTVNKHWAFARAWLQRQLTASDP